MPFTAQLEFMAPVRRTVSFPGTDPQAALEYFRALACDLGRVGTVFYDEGHGHHVVKMTDESGAILSQNIPALGVELQDGSGAADLGATKAVDREKLFRLLGPMMVALGDTMEDVCKVLAASGDALGTMGEEVRKLAPSLPEDAAELASIGVRA